MRGLSSYVCKRTSLAVLPFEERCVNTELQSFSFEYFFLSFLRVGRSFPEIRLYRLKESVDGRIIEYAKPADQAVFIDGPDLVDGDLSLSLVKDTFHAGWIGFDRGSQRCRRDGIEVFVGLVR